MRDKNRLDQFVLDIEFLLISVVQGVALAALAASAVEPIAKLQLEFWPYIISAFLIIIIFWSNAIVHALSFISWPLDLTHNFLYFLASFVEVLAYSEMSDPARWFAFIFALFVVAALLYIVDLQLIKQSKQKFVESEAKKRLYNHIFSEQAFELKTLVPMGLIFNFGAFWIIKSYPAIFLGQKYHLVLIVIQVLFELIVLAVAIKSFKKRSRLITESL